MEDSPRRSCFMINTKHILILAAVSFILLLSGCPGPIKPVTPDVITRGKGDIRSAVASLEKHKAGVKPVRASGKLKYVYYKDGKKTEENPDLQLAFSPPNNLFFRARVLGIEVLRLGSNDQEFWFLMPPQEISEYYWGKWDQLKGCKNNLLISPRNILDALGMVTVDQSWLLIEDKGQDVLVKLGDNGKMTRRIYIDRSTYLPTRIEYLDDHELEKVGINLSDYRPIADGSPVPAKIDITTINIGEVTSRIEIKLNNPTFLKPEKIGKRTFVMPTPKGFKHVKKICGD